MMMKESKRIKVSSGAKWEDIVGYSRGIRVGNTVEIAGTTAMNKEGEVIGENDVYEQTKGIISIAEKALKECDASLSDVVRTRIFTTDISQWEAIGKAHGEYFKDIKPVSTMVEVNKLINQDILVEIEFTAILN
jgi:enamine deaminase RidA (YjgF/YER057c/UK114 family)